MARILTFLFFIHLASGNSTEVADRKGFSLEEIQDRVADTILSVTRFLESFNDQYFGKSAIGNYINYDEIKPKLDRIGEESRGLKKMAIGLIPLVFHIGATSTWMILTTILAAKSVFIGLILLVFKIAVSSAKVGSFFTALKSHTFHGHHEYQWSPPHEHHGYRSINGIGPIHDVTSHGWDHDSSYKTIPTEYIAQGHTESIDKRLRI